LALSLEAAASEDVGDRQGKEGKAGGQQDEVEHRYSLPGGLALCRGPKPWRVLINGNERWGIGLDERKVLLRAYEIEKGGGLTS
jgi:hypothetical protein